MARRGREFWVTLVEEFERGGVRQDEFVAGHGVSLGGFQHWLYRLRRERRGEQKSVRLLPVTIGRRGRSQTPMAVELAVGSCVLRFTSGLDCTYVAQLAVALRRAAMC
jgi:hypothetical protein